MFIHSFVLSLTAGTSCTWAPVLTPGGAAANQGTMNFKQVDEMSTSQHFFLFLCDYTVLYCTADWCHSNKSRCRSDCRLQSEFEGFQTEMFDWQVFIFHDVYGLWISIDCMHRSFIQHHSVLLSWRQVMHTSIEMKRNHACTGSEGRLFKWMDCLWCMHAHEYMRSHARTACLRDTEKRVAI